VNAAHASALSFRTRLLLAFMLVVGGLTALVLTLAERNLAANVARDFERAFSDELTALQRVQELRHAALAERCRALVRKPRIHAALEDGALDLLYPSAADELRDIMVPADSAASIGLHAEFYRFLDRNGAVIPPPASAAVGALAPAESAQLVLPRAPDTPQLGYIVRAASAAALSEIITTPIVSSEHGEVISALVLGFKPLAAATALGLARSIWLDRRLYPPAPAVAAEIFRTLAHPPTAGRTRFDLAGVPHLLFSEQLNPGSLYGPAAEVSIYSLAEFLAQQRRLRWQILGVGALLLLAGFSASQFLATRLSRPVEKLAVDSAAHLAGRTRAEAALESTGEELQRAARFSADASHQLKTPVTVLRAGLEEILTHDHLSTTERESLAVLVHQTYRLSGVIEDLLLLSRLDAGRLRLEFAPVDLAALIAAAVDDLTALPVETEFAVETDFPPTLLVAAERRYAALILQNLLENARKYNRPDGRIRLAARTVGGVVELVVGNTGRTIPSEAQAHIFERFHRGAVGENLPGYGLGLNLARELARLHGGDLRLLRSAADWTEFAVTFRPASPATA
jgi:signal transduction histidine kinase